MQGQANSSSGVLTGIVDARGLVVMGWRSMKLRTRLNFGTLPGFRRVFTVVEDRPGYWVPLKVEAYQFMGGVVFGTQRAWGPAN